MNSLKGLVRDGKLSWNVFTQLRLSVRNNSTNAEIKIPNRIERGPTDILKALESTIHRDPSAMPYSYIDDPFLLPHSNFSKRTYALCMESGRKAAIWIRQNHSELFQHKEADPVIQAFIPKPTYTKKSEVSEEVLLNAIKQAQIEEARHIYELLEKDISDKAKLSLLELLCYYNDYQPTETEFLEEKWLRQADDKRTFWVMDPDVDNLFTYLSGSTDEAVVASAYNAMIAACGKYYRVDRAQELVQECYQKGIPLNVTAYNNLIQATVTQSPETKVREEKMLTLLREMNRKNVRPNVQTLNACLSIMNDIPYHNGTYQFITTVLSEFKRIGIYPCLTSYYYIAHMLRKAPANVGDAMLNDIVSDLEQLGQLQAQDLKDTLFFTTAMDLARYNFNFNIAERIHNILLSGNNYKFIGSQYRENIYYRNFTLLLLAGTPIGEFMEIYHSLVPNVYIPETIVMDTILSAMSANEPDDIANFLPTIWSQIVMFDFTKQRNLIFKFFDIVLNVNSFVSNKSNCVKEHATIAWKYFQLVEERIKAAKREESVEGRTLGKILILLMKNQDYEQVVEIFKFVNKYENISDCIPPETLVSLMEKCVKQKLVDVAFYILEYSIRCEFEESKTLSHMIKALPMTPKEKRLLSGLLGESDQIKKQEQEKPESEQKEN